MEDRQVHLLCAVAWALWAGDTLLAVGGTVAATYERLDLALVIYAHMAILAAVAGSVTVACLLQRQTLRLMRFAELQKDVTARVHAHSRN